MVSIIVWLLILCIVAVVAFYAIDQLSVPEPINRVVKLVVVVLVLIAVISLLMPLAGGFPRLQ